MKQKVWYICNNERIEPMNNEPNKLVELTEKELKGIVGGTDPMSRQGETKSPMKIIAEMLAEK